MELYPLQVPDPGRAWAEGQARRLAAGPSGEGKTVAEILGEASARMDEQDRRDALARDPVRYAGPPRRRGLLARLLGR